MIASQGTPTPTQEIYEFLNALFEGVNAACFDDALPAVVMILKGKSNLFGYYKTLLRSGKKNRLILGRCLL